MRLPICTVGIKDFGALWLVAGLSMKYAAMAVNNRPNIMAVKSNFFMMDKLQGTQLNDIYSKDICPLLLRC
jgi:hypothetical protein